MNVLYILQNTGKAQKEFFDEHLLGFDFLRNNALYIYPLRRLAIS
jgi:hypothetical protein